MKTIINGLLTALVVVQLVLVYAVLWVEALCHGSRSVWPEVEE